MRKRFGLIATVAAAASLLGASGASAATEVGNDCAATGGIANYTLVQLAKAPGSPLPITAPAGVVTKWKVNSAIEVAVSQQLQILRPTGNPNEFLTVAESTAGTVVKGLNSFDTRIPIQSGDRLAASGGSAGGAIPAPLYCPTGNPADSMGLITSEPAVGSTNAYSPNPGYQVAISAIVEPDADNDGFGDETQDKCPQSAAVQVDCPPIVLTTTGIARNGLAQILVGASSAASVSVSGTVNVPKRKKAKAGKSAVISLNGGTQLLAPGVIATFTLILPQRVKAALRALPRKRFLTLTATASATDVAGRPSSSTVKVKLRGTKPAPKGKAKGQK